jgi:hypothetical protein
MPKSTRRKFRLLLPDEKADSERSRTREIFRRFKSRGDSMDSRDSSITNLKLRVGRNYVKSIDSSTSRDNTITSGFKKVRLKTERLGRTGHIRR